MTVSRLTSSPDAPEPFAAIEQVTEHLAADLAGGGSDDDHGNPKA